MTDMDELQFWILVEDLFKQMADNCDRIRYALQGPITPDEAARMLEDAKEYLEKGE